MQRLEVSGTVRTTCMSLGVKRLIHHKYVNRSTAEKLGNFLYTVKEIFLV